MTEYASPETSRRVLDLMRRQALDGLVAVSARDLAAELSIGRQTALNALRRLLDDGEIAVARRGTGHLYPTAYRVTEGSV